jgi:WD40 repeat protein
MRVARGFLVRQKWIAGLAVLASVSVAAGAELAAQPTVLHAARVIHCCGGEDVGHSNDAPQCSAVATGVAMTPDGRTVAAALDDRCVVIWNADKPDHVTRLAGHADWVRSVGLSADGKTLASGAQDRCICLWDIATRQCIVHTPACDSAIACVCFHPNGQQVAVVGFSKGMHIVNTSSGQTSQELVCPCGDVRTAVFSPDGARLAVAGRNGRIRMWNVADASREHDIETDRRRIRGLAFSPNGRMLAAAGNSTTIRIYDVATGTLAATLETRPAKVFALVFLNDTTLATGGSDNHVSIWDLNTRQVTHRLEGHTGTVAALACDAKGETLVTASYDTTLRMWNLGQSDSPAVAQSPSDSMR